jgi:hypothetical protein
MLLARYWPVTLVVSDSWTYGHLRPKAPSANPGSERR